MGRVEERFTFVPTPREALDALRVVTRSMSRQTANPVRQLLICAGIYGVPLTFAATFFRSAFDEIYLTFFVFVVAAMVLPRLFRGTSSAFAEQYSVNIEVGVNSDGIKQTTPAAETSWPWTSLNRVHLLEKLVVLEFRDWSWIPLPNRLWADEGSKAVFLDKIRRQAPDSQPGLPGEVASPFTLVNVGAGFGAMDVFLSLMVVLTRVARVGCGCSVSWQLGGHPVPFGVLYASVIGISVAAFFPIRSALRALDRSHHLAAVLIANLLIWPVPVGLIIYAIVR